MADTRTAESTGRQPAPPGTEAAQRARSRMEEDSKLREQRQKEDAELAKKAAGGKGVSDQEKMAAADQIAHIKATAGNLQATGSPTGTVSAKENQAVAQPVDSGSTMEPKEGEAPPPTSGVVEPLSGVDKNADMPYQPPVMVPAPTQDPPINVSGKVPVGSARVDLTRTIGSGQLAGEALQGQPQGHLGSFGESETRAAAEDSVRNPPARQGMGTTERR